MSTLPFALYDAFSDIAFGGSQAGIVLQAGGLTAKQRLQIARELGLPAVCFVSDYSGRSVTARFQSTEREYPMCGHGTVCLMTYLIEQGILGWDNGDRIDVDLNLPTTTTPVEIYRRDDGRAVVMLDIKASAFRQDKIDVAELAELLNLSKSGFRSDLPIETAIGDFVHLIVPVKDLTFMGSIEPNFSGIIEFCQRYGIETIACFSQEVEQSGHDLHVRDFCPAVGVPESAAAGTTNAALTSYVIRHGLVSAGKSRKIRLAAEQGIELGRPSLIQSFVEIKDGVISRLQIGGVATRVFEGSFLLKNNRAGRLKQLV